MGFVKRIRRGAVCVSARLLTAGLNVVGRRLAMFWGAMIGLAAWRLASRDRYKSLRHLSLVYGNELSFDRRRRIARDFFINIGKNLADVLRFPRHFASELKPLVAVEGLEHFDAAYRRGRGLIGITGHIGNFELLAVYIASLGYDIAVIGREMYDPRLNELLVKNREALGLINIATTDSPRRVLEWLRKGGAVGALIDTDSIRVRSTFVPVFGRPALTPIGQSIIGLRAGSAFVPLACVRTSDNRYRIIIKPEVSIEPSGDFSKDVEHVTARCTAVLEGIINEYRDQWIWLKNRWLTAP